MAKALLRQRLFPSQYPDDAVKVLETMAFCPNNLVLVGSSSIRSQIFSGDYDANEVVEANYATDSAALDNFVKRFQTIIKNLQKLKNTYIGDIKSGLVEEWRIIPKEGTYNYKAASDKIESLHQKNILSSEEVKEAKAVLKPHPTPTQLAVARQTLKYHLVRWTPEEILKGSKKLVDGRIYLLKEGFSSPTITKLDVISLTGARYAEFSAIYEFNNNGKVLNPDLFDPEASIKENLLYYKSQKNYYKVAKRKFVLAKLKGNDAELKRYSELLNSELGKVYVIYNDVKTLADLLESVTIPKASLDAAISRFRDRLGYIYAYEPYLKKEDAIYKDLQKAADSKKPVPILRHLESQFFGILNASPKLIGAGKSYIAYSI
jgi:hypothetical protein